MRDFIGMEQFIDKNKAAFALAVLDIQQNSQEGNFDHE